MIRGTPINLEFYIPVSDMEIGFFLQQNGYLPSYGDSKYLYFEKIQGVQDILNKLRKGGE
jgi:hypothetical protein|nr:MAG TPA: hypothetical protein [Caudoviricetes sp.]